MDAMVIRSRSEPGVRRYAPSRRVRLVADLGLALLPVLAVETLTGLVLFLFAHGLTPKGSAWAGHVFDLLAAAHLLVIQDISFQDGRTFCSARQMDIAGRGRSSELRRALPNQKNVLH